MGPQVVPYLLAYARENVIPEMGKLDEELLCEEDLKFVTDYLSFVNFIRSMIETKEDMNLIRPLLDDPDPQVKRFAGDILEGLEERLEE
jgi:hypothetical protein